MSIYLHATFKEKYKTQHAVFVRGTKITKVVSVASESECTELWELERPL
jgi:hypothetical protein